MPRKKKTDLLDFFSKLIQDKIEKLSMEDTVKFSGFVLVTFQINELLMQTKEVMEIITTQLGQTMYTTSRPITYSIINYWVYAPPTQSGQKDESSEEKKKKRDQLIDLKVLTLSFIIGYYIVYHPNVIVQTTKNIIDLAKQLLGKGLSTEITSSIITGL